jgi:hypothetical protein
MSETPRETAGALPGEEPIDLPKWDRISSMGTSKPGEAQTTDFTVPASLAHGTCTLYVAACGISSGGYTFTY